MRGGGASRGRRAASGESPHAHLTWLPRVRQRLERLQVNKLVVGHLDLHKEASSPLEPRQTRRLGSDLHTIVCARNDLMRIADGRPRGERAAQLGLNGRLERVGERLDLLCHGLLFTKRTNHLIHLV